MPLNILQGEYPTMPLDRALDGDELMAASPYGSAHVQCFWNGCMVRLECTSLTLAQP